MEKQHRQGDPGVGPSRPRVQIQAGSLLFLGDVRSSLREGEADTDTAPVYAVLLGRDPRDARRWVAVPADDVPIEPDGDLFLAPTADPAEVAGLWVRMPLAFTIADEEVRRLEVCGRVGSAHVLEIADVLTGADDDGVEDLAGIDEVDAAFDRRERLLVAIADMLPDAGPEADLSTELRSIRRDEGTVVVAVEPGAPASELRLAAAGPRDPVDRDRRLKTEDGRGYRLRFDLAGGRAILIPDIVDDLVEVTIGGEAAEVRADGYRGPLVDEAGVAVARCVLRTSLGSSLLISARLG